MVIGGKPEQQEDLLALVLAATLEGMVEHDLRSGTVRYDERWLRLVGFDAEAEVIPSPNLWLDLCHPDDREELDMLWKEHVENAWPFQHTWRMRHAHGGYRWVLCRSVVRLSDDGTPTLALSLFSDVTERVEASRRHEALVDAIPDTIVRIHVDGRVLDSRVAEDQNHLVLVPPAATSSEVRHSFPPPLGGGIQDLVRSCVETGYLMSMDWHSDDGVSSRHFEVRATPSGKDEAVCLIRDVTERKHLESQLLQAQKLESIGQLAAGVAHEINTPLQFIGDNARFVKTALGRLQEILESYRPLLEEFVPSEKLQLLRRAEKKAKLPFLLENTTPSIASCIEGVERVAEIVSAMKEFSHPGSDQPDPSDINRAISSTIKVSTNEWKHVATIELDLDDSLPQVQCLAGELNQCFLNIIVNAAHALGDKFGDTQQGVIRISTKKVASGIEIRIEDNGPGIPDHVKARIFDPFFTTKAVGKGTGQGLSIARRTIVDKHHGELTCDSKVGESTTFVIRLPLTQTLDAAVA